MDSLYTSLLESTITEEPSAKRKKLVESSTSTIHGFHSPEQRNVEMSQEVHNEHPSDYYDRYSRQHYVLGEAAMNRMAKSNVFISGIGGLGIEIGTWLFFLRLFLCHMRF